MDARRTRSISALPWRAARHFAATAAIAIGAPAGPVAVAAARPVVVRVVASTNVYADVARQIGGGHIIVTGILSNPNADPHTYESSTTDAAAVAHATLIVRNGLGYDDFITRLADASPRADRVVIEAGSALGYHNGDNPHIWYDPATMPRVAGLVAGALSRQDPADRLQFAANLRAFDRSLAPWTRLIGVIRKRFAGTPVAITEPVFSYAARALGLKVLTPNSFSMAIMQGNDPAPQDVQFMLDLLARNQVKCFFYNQQAVTPITARLRTLARDHHVPIVAVYETKPANKTYQQWMLAEVQATDDALTRRISTEHLL